MYIYNCGKAICRVLALAVLNSVLKKKILEMQLQERFVIIIHNCCIIVAQFSYRIYIISKCMMFDT